MVTLASVCNRSRVMKTFALLTFLFAVFFMLEVSPVMAADVEVYAEGAYTGGDLALYVYTDISALSILSCGVKITYDDIKLSLANAQKNEDIWYMGNSAAKEGYIEPDTSTLGEIIVIGGLLDTSAPLKGTTGARVLVGMIEFTRTDLGNPGEDPVSFFGIACGLGKGGSYANFVSTDTADGVNGVLDGQVDFSTQGAEIHERGDATGDGKLDGRDISSLRLLIGTPDTSCWCDCNGDGVLDGRDIRCLRTMIS